MDKAILDRLRQTNRPISGETLASELGISRVALWKRVKSLKTWGYDIRATRKGYELLGDDGLAPADLTVGPPTLVFPETQSTMDEARKAAGNGAPSGTLILALRQNGGRGRFGRT
jgi:BirA family biotin operon repressor/biotin-[acetyl-CoA-carboxylase] ligase